MCFHMPQANRHLPLSPDSPDEAGRAGRDPGSMPHEPSRLCRHRARHELRAAGRSCRRHRALRTHRADTWVLLYGEWHTTNHKLQATVHLPLFSYSSQAIRVARASQSKPVRFPTLLYVICDKGNDAEPSPRPLKRHGPIAFAVVAGGAWGNWRDESKSFEPYN